MQKKGTLCFIFLFVLSAFFTTATAVNSNELIVFEKDFTITGWHLHASHRKFDVDNPGSGLLTINKITPDKQINGGFVLLNGKFFFLKNFLTGNESVFTKDIMQKATNHLTVFLRGTPGASITIEISNRAPSSPPEIIAFTAQPPSIKIAESSILTWQTQSVASCVIEPGNINVSSNGSIPVSPTETTTYTLMAMGDGDPATAMVTVTIENSVPVSNAGSDQSVFVGDTVSLNGSGSGDVDGDILSYQWSFSSVPAGSTVAPSDSSIVNPSFVPDIVGTYAVQLIVNDGSIDSDPDMVLITANPRMVTVPDVVGQIQADAEAAITGVNLTVGALTETSHETVLAGRVISQQPAGPVAASV